MVDTDSLKAQIDELKKNPVFNMSLSGKELFHSNMLAMFLQQTKDDKPTELAEKMITLFPPLLKSEEKKENYVVFDVLREKFNFDLLIIYCTKDDRDNLKEAKIESYNDIFFKNKKIADEEEQNEYLSELNDELDNNRKNDVPDIVSRFRYVIIENKFKSIPYKEQLNKYSEKIKSLFDKVDNMSFDITKENCKYYLFAPEESLNVFFSTDSEYKHSFTQGKNKKLITVTWERRSYQDFAKMLLEKSETDKPFIIDFAKEYSNFLNIMLNLYDKEIVDKIINDKKCFLSEKQNAIFLSARIQDFYEKILFSRLLFDLRKDLNLPENSFSFENEDFFYANTDYTRQSGILNFRYAWKGDIYTQGIQIQNGSFEIVLCAEKKPFGIENETADFSILNDYSKNKEMNAYENEKVWLHEVYKKISEKYPALKNKSILKLKKQSLPYSFITKDYAFLYALIDLKELDGVKDYRDVKYDTLKNLLKVALEVIPSYRFSSNMEK